MRRGWNARLDSLETRNLLTASPELVSHGAVCTCAGCLPPRDLPQLAIAPRPSLARESLVIPRLESNPSAPVTIFLDFDGDAGGAWGGYTVTPTPAFDTNNDSAHFDATEIDEIRRMWQLVVDAYSPFDVNVTTADPGPLVDGASVRAVVGGNSNWTGGNYGGLAFIGSFTNTLPNTVWVFSDLTGRGSADHVGWTARVISHELGHSFGLWHQSVISPSTGFNEGEYDNGTPLTSPLMGYQYAGQRSTWRTGLNTLGEMQNDVATMLAGGLSPIVDDVPTGQTRLLTLGTPIGGRIETPTDTDSFTFTLASSRIINFRADPPLTGVHGTGTLDVAMRLTGAGVNRDLDSFALGESLSVALAPGTYTLQVRAGSTRLGYSNLGSYTVSATAVDAVHSVDLNDNRMRVSWSTVGGAGIYIVRASSPALPYESVYDVVPASGGTSQSKDYHYFGTGIDVVIEAYASAGDLTTPLARYGAIRADLHEFTSGPFVTPTSGDPVEAEDFLAEYVSNIADPNPINPSERRTIDLTDQNLGNARHYRPTIVDLDQSTDPGRPGYVVTRTQPGEELTYFINNGNAGLYVVELRVSNPQSGGSVAVRLDGGISNLFSTTLNIPSTGSFDTYRTIRTAPFTLEAGVPGFYRMLKIKFLTASSTGSAGNFDYFQLVPYTLVQPPLAPTSLAASSTLVGNVPQVHLNWVDNSGDEQGFHIERRLSGQDDTAWQVWRSVGPNVSAYTSTQNLAAGTTYDFRVVAYNDNGRSSPSNVATIRIVTPIAQPPAAPTGLAASYDPSSNIVRLVWRDNSNNETEFVIQRRLRGQGASSWRYATRALPNNTSAIDGGVLRDTAYEYRVLAVNSGGTGVSNIVSITTSRPDTPPAAPSDFRGAFDRAANLVRFSWQDNSTNESHFIIQRRYRGEGDSAWRNVLETGANANAGTDDQILLNVVYEYRVLASNDGGYSVSNLIEIGTALIQAPIRLRTPSTALPRNVLLAWDDRSNNESGFEVQRRVINGTWSTLVTTGTNINWFRDTTAASGARYEYRVRAFGPAGREPSEFSNTLSVSLIETSSR